MPAQVVRVVDFETTGIKPPCDVIEVGFCDVVLTDAGWRVGPPVSTLYGSDAVTAETRAIHHIAPVEVAGRDRFHADHFVGHCMAQHVDAFAAHHASFEAQWLGDLTIPLICTYKAALRVWPDAPAHSNQFLRYWLEEQGLSRPNPAYTMPAHRAGPDAYATAHLLRVLLSQHRLEDLVTWTEEPAWLPRLPIGKQRGAKWADVEGGFLLWMLRQADMDRDLIWNARHELERRGAL